MCKIDTVINGLQAFQKVKENLEKEPKEFYDLVVLDLGMPIVDGYQASEKINDLFQEDRLFMFQEQDIVKKES